MATASTEIKVTPAIAAGRAIAIYSHRDVRDVVPSTRTCRCSSGHQKTAAAWALASNWRALRL